MRMSSIRRGNTCQMKMAETSMLLEKKGAMLQGRMAIG
jgi:hypothetical protein